MKNNAIEYIKSYISTFKKITIFKILNCIIFACCLLGTVAMTENSKQVSLVDISYEIIDSSNPVYIDKVIINNSEYTGVAELDENKTDDGYKLNIDHLNFEISKNDDISIMFKDENIKNIVISVDDKKIEPIYNDVDEDVIINYDNSISTIGLIKDQIQSWNITSLICLSIIGIFISYILINFIYLFIYNIFNKKTRISEFLIATFSLFILYYYSFYILINLISIIVVIPILLILAFIIYKNKDSVRFKFENIFIVISLFLGITMLYAVPAFNVPDEGNHFAKAYDHLFYLESDKTEVKSDGNAYIHLSKNMEEFYKEFTSNTLNYDYHMNTKSYFDYYSLKLNKNDFSDEFVWSGTYSANNLAYVPANISIFISKVLNFSPIMLFLFARLANLISYLLLTYYAIKIAPKYKHVFFLVATFAIAYHQGIGINQDFLNNGIFFLLTAFLFKNIFSDKNISKKDLIIILILSLGLALCKTIYTPVVLLVLLISNNKFKTTKQAWVSKFMIIFLAVLSTGLAYYLTTHFNSTGAVLSRNTYPFSTIFTSPFEIAKMYITTIVMRFSLDTFRGLFDGFGWSTVWNKDLILYICVIFYTLLIATLPKEKIGDIKKERIFKILCLFIFMILAGLISASMLFGWTIVGTNYIDGLQPRYFIPMLPLLYIFFTNNIFNIKVKNYEYFMSLLIIMLNALCLITIIYGFYL